MDKVFLQLSEIHDMIGERYRSQAYKKVYDIIQKSEFKITVDNMDSWKDLPGIGQASEKKIIEYLTTGKIQKLLDIRKRPDVKACIKLTQIMGIGPVKARTLFNDYQINNITQLRKSLKDQPDLIKREALLGVKYFADLQKRIPYQEMDKAVVILEQLVSMNKSYRIQLAGSYRRNINKKNGTRQSSGDIDIVLTHNDVFVKEDLKKSGHLKVFYECIKHSEIFVDCIKLGKISATVLVRIDKIVRHVDIRLFPKESFWTALLHYTGSWEHNIRLRRLAIEKKMQLTEYGLFQIVKGKSVRLPIHSERDVFKLLDIPYVSPENR